MIRIRWAVFAIALGCLLSVGRPVAANAFTSTGATSASAQGLRAASARVAHAERTAPQPARHRPARRNPATPTHRAPTHPRTAKHSGRTHQPDAISWYDRNFSNASDVESVMPDRFRAQMGETERALGSRGPPRASPPVRSARVELPPFSTTPSALSVSSARSIRAPPPAFPPDPFDVRTISIRPRRPSMRARRRRPPLCPLETTDHETDPPFSSRVVRGRRSPSPGSHARGSNANAQSRGDAGHGAQVGRGASC